jgi:hypothetical protein
LVLPSHDQVISWFLLNAIVISYSISFLGLGWG